MSLALPTSTLPLSDFLIDRESGQRLIERLEQHLVNHERLLVWGARVGAIELTEDLFTHWPTSATGGAQIVAVNPGALWTRTRAGTADSGWVSWVELSASRLLEQVLDRAPEGVVVSYASQLVGALWPRLLGGPFGLVTAVAADSAQGALDELTRLGADASKFDALVGVQERERSTFITEVARLDGGAPKAVTIVRDGHYAAA